MEFINQNILLIGIVVVSGLGLLWPLLFRPVGKAVNPGEATLLINREEAAVLDVREPAEFAAGHIPEALNIPVAKLDERLGELEKYREKPLIVCCAAGMRSNKACAELKKQGFAHLNNLSGGVDAWVAAGYPLKKAGRK
ncbi:rhodanese-like domain-containing protein [Azonexus sp. R2A61]|uniref:rhodanese-like domain-containing protein n=1 Tax=Azonexus sp. R2A61 TaxID=2744443 RepID=UPI001F1B754B|nr:rhodanese-like domain-containing protein [Azonexus sp. R2A61]